MSTSSPACPRCRVAVVPNATHCRACGVRLSHSAEPGTDARPPVWITTENYHPLEVLARRHRAVAAPVGDFLLSEIARAVVCAPDWIAPDIVTMNSRVVFTTDTDAEPDTRVLVYPDRYDPNGQAISILSPLGAALLGLASGSAMTYADRQGKPASVRVERVAYQPEAMRRHAGPPGPLQPSAA